MGNGVAGACVSGCPVLQLGDPALHTSSWGRPTGGSEVLEVPEAGTARPANGEGLVCGPQLRLSCHLSLILLRSPQGEFCNCRDNLESALAVLGRPVPTSSLSMAPRAPVGRSVSPDAPGRCPLGQGERGREGRGGEVG